MMSLTDFSEEKKLTTDVFWFLGAPRSDCQVAPSLSFKLTPVPCGHGNALSISQRDHMIYDESKHSIKESPCNWETVLLKVWGTLSSGDLGFVSSPGLI